MIDEKLIHNQIHENLFVHDVFSSFFRGVLNWVQDGFDKRFNYKVISTYDKAVQFFNQKRKSKDGSVQTNILPSVTLDPNLDFAPEDRSGKFLWMYKNLDCFRGRNFYNQKIELRDQGVVITIMRTRYSGTFDLTFWLQSIYELIDIRTKLLQNCNGIGRWIRPEWFWSHVILPKELVEFKRSEDGKPLDWSATPREIVQLATTNSKEYGIPIHHDGIWKLDSLSDGSTKYGADQLTEWKLTATFTWEANIPTFLRLDNYAFFDMHPQIHCHIGPTYSSQPLLNNIKVYRLYEENDLIKTFLNLYKVTIVDENASPFVKLDNSQCDVFPEFYDNFNQIAIGKLYTYDELLDLDREEQFPSEYILLLDKYDEKLHKDYLRRSNGCICRWDDKYSEFYEFASSIQLPTICKISDKLYNMLETKTGMVITMDPVSMSIYSDVCKLKMLNIDDRDKLDYTLSSKILDFINKHDIYQSQEYKDLHLGENVFVIKNRKDFIAKYDPKISQYRLAVPITSMIQSKFKLYINGEYFPRSKYELSSSKIEFNDDVDINPGAIIESTIEGYCESYIIDNAINYQMTKEDERAYYTRGENIKITLPPEFDADYIKCCSYNGILDEHSDYEVLEDGRTIVFKLKPVRDKVIQVFANRT